MQGSGVEQLGNLYELLPARFDNKDPILDALVSSVFVAGGDGHYASIGLQDSPGAIDGVAADSVKDDINVRDCFFEARRFVVNDLVGPEPFYEFGVGRRRRGDDVCDVKCASWTANRLLLQQTSWSSRAALSFLSSGRFRM
jgi:hypothetical protein